MLSPRLSHLALLLVALVPACSAEADAPADDEGQDQDVVTSTSPDRLLDVPFYFSVPKSVVKTEINRAKYSYSTVWQPSVEVKDAGLRIIAIKQAGTSPAAKKAAREDMARQLSAAGVLQDGDIALTFRPELAGTMAYPHIQMGTTHASLVYTKGGVAYNVDSPLDGEYVGQFNTLHFTGGTTSSGTTDYGTDALQIVRPRITDARRAQLGKWATAVASNRANGHVRFQKDYLAPIFASKRMTTKQTVTELGKIILGASTNDMPMYCSEFAWHMIALSNCTEADIRAAGADGAACVDPVFAPMQLVGKDSSLVGLAEGPLLSLQVAPAADRARLVEQIFPNPGNPGKLSSGHRAVSEQVAPLMPGLKQYFQARAAGATPEQTASGADQINAGVQNVPNYSPTAFLVNSMQADGVRKVDYIATVVFVDRDSDAIKAKKLAMPSGTSIPQ